MAQKLGDYFEGSRQWAFDKFEAWLAAPPEATVSGSDSETDSRLRARRFMRISRAAEDCSWMTAGSDNCRVMWKPFRLARIASASVATTLGPDNTRTTAQILLPVCFI